MTDNTHSEEAAELLWRADAAIEDGNLTEALDLLRQARELQPTAEINTRYNQLRRRKELEARLRDIEADYQGKLNTHSLPDALKALRRALDALLEPESGLPSEVRDRLLALVRLGDQEEGLALGKEELWQTAQNLLAQIGRAGVEHWTAGRAYYFADPWARLARDVALRGIIASAIALGDIRASYRAATARLRWHLTDEEVIKEHAKIRELLIDRLNDSASKRLSRAEQAVAEGRFSVALENLKSLEGDIYEPVEEEFPGMLEHYSEVAEIRGEAERLSERAERLSSLYKRYYALLKAAEAAFVTGDLVAAERELRKIQLSDLSEAPDLHERAEALRDILTDSWPEATNRALDAVETQLGAAISEDKFRQVLDALAQMEEMRLTDEQRKRWRQLASRTRKTLERFQDDRERQIETLIGQAKSAIEAWRFPGAQETLKRARSLLEDLPIERQHSWSAQVGTLLLQTEELDKALSDLGKARIYFEKGINLQETEDLLVGVMTLADKGAVAKTLKEKARSLLNNIDSTEGHYETVKRRLYQALQDDPTDEDSWRRVKRVLAEEHLAEIQRQLEQTQQRRQQDLAAYTQGVGREASWWLGGSLFSAVVAFLTLIYAILFLIQKSEPLSYLTPLYTLLPGVPSALFFKQYASANQRVDAQRDKVSRQAEEYEREAVVRIEAIYAQMSEWSEGLIGSGTPPGE